MDPLALPRPTAIPPPTLPLPLLLTLIITMAGPPLLSKPVTAPRPVPERAILALALLNSPNGFWFSPGSPNLHNGQPLLYRALIYVQRQRQQAEVW